MSRKSKASAAESEAGRVVDALDLLRAAQEIVAPLANETNSGMTAGISFLTASIAMFDGLVATDVGGEAGVSIGSIALDERSSTLGPTTESE